LLVRRIAHLAVASPPLFVLIGVVFYLLHAPSGDSVFWGILWLAALITAAWAMRGQGSDRPASSTPNPIPLRVAHGTSALLIVLIFLAWHLLNHASAAFSHENVKRLQGWIALPSIAAENRNYPQGPDYLAQLARDAGFANVEIVPTSGKPGVFGTLDAGATTTVGIYFMYDVKQFDPSEWSSPPLEGRIVDKERLGRICVGRGAVNQKGPETAFLGALHAFKAAGTKLPVNLVLVCEGEEEIGSTHFPEVVHQPKVTAALKKCMGVFIPEAGQDVDGGIQMSLGAKGVVELELVSSGERWGRGPKHDVHSILEAQVDSPAWHLVQALNTLIESDGHTPAVAGFFDQVKPLTPAQMKMIQDAAARRSEATVKKQLGVEHWVHDTNWLDSLVLLESKPTINIEGLVGGYTGPVARPFCRIVPSRRLTCGWCRT
jgi:hypothetical protein